MLPSGRSLILPLLFGLVAFAAARQQPAQPPTQAQQRPVFRGGTHFVRVDAYPMQEGRIVEGLGPDDFEVFEDDKPQKIESFDFLTFEGFTPDAELHEPQSQREGFDLAADPRYRVFVIFVDLAYSQQTGAVTPAADLDRIQQPLSNFLDRVLGPQDLFGFLTSRNSAKDLVLAQRSTVTKAQIADLWRSSLVDRDQADELDGCGCGNVTDLRTCEAMIYALKMRHRADDTYAALEGLIAQLGGIREERKNVILVTDQLTRTKPDTSALAKRGPVLPQPGVANGRLGVGDRQGVEGNDAYCASEFQRLGSIDFDVRYRDLLRDARKENVSFYPITPAGLQAPVTLAGVRAVTGAVDDLISLAHETDGLAIVNTNDLNGGMKRIADDLGAYYVLGYYTTNTKFDGGIRNIRVRYKGKPIRARRQYRAPTEAEIAALAAGPPQSPRSSGATAGPSPREAALTILERASRPFAAYVATSGKTLNVVAELSAASIQAGRWKNGADVDVTAIGANSEPLGTAKGKIDAGAFSTMIAVPMNGPRPARVSVRLQGEGSAPADDYVKLDPPSGTLVGDPIAYRSGSRIATRPVAGFEFARNEHLRVEWPVLAAALDRRELRLLDRNEKPLPVELPLAEDIAKKTIVLDISLSGLPHNDYLLELTAGAGGTVEKRLLAIRVK